MNERVSGADDRYRTDGTEQRERHDEPPGQADRYRAQPVPTQHGIHVPQRRRRLGVHGGQDGTGQGTDPATEYVRRPAPQRGGVGVDPADAAPGRPYLTVHS